MGSRWRVSVLSRIPSPPDLMTPPPFQVRTDHIVRIHRQLSDARLLRPTRDLCGGVQEAPRRDARALHGWRDAGRPGVGTGPASLAVVRAARARGPLRVAHRERVLRAHRDARGRDMRGQVGRADAEPAAGVDG